MGFTVSSPTQVAGRPALSSAAWPKKVQTDAAQPSRPRARQQGGLSHAPVMTQSLRILMVLCLEEWGSTAVPRRAPRSHSQVGLAQQQQGGMGSFSCICALLVLCVCHPHTLLVTHHGQVRVRVPQQGTALPLLSLPVKPLDPHKGLLQAQRYFWISQ